MKQLTTGSIGDMISGARKRRTPPHVVTHLADHEAKHGLADKGPGEYGLLLATATQQIIEIINNRITIIKKEIEVVIGAFYRPIGERSPQARKEIAEAPGFLEMSGSKNQGGDLAIWHDANRELLQDEQAERLQRQFEESEASTLKKPLTDDKDTQLETVEPQWFTTQTSEDFELTPEQESQEQPEFSALPKDLSSDLYEIFSDTLVNLFEIETEEQRSNLFSLFQDFLHDSGIENDDSRKLPPTPEQLTKDFVKSLYEPTFQTPNKPENSQKKDSKK